MYPRTLRKLAVWTRIVIRFRERDLFLGPVRDEGGQHRDLLEQRLDVAKDHAGLFPVGGQDHDDAPLAGGQDVAVGLEAREEHRDEGGDPRLASSSADHEPGFPSGGRGRHRAAGEAGERLDLGRGHRQAEQGLQEDEPGPPVGPGLEPGAEEMWVGDRLDEVQGGGGRAGPMAG